MPFGLLARAGLLRFGALLVVHQEQLRIISPWAKPMADHAMPQFLLPPWLLLHPPAATNPMTQTCLGEEMAPHRCLTANALWSDTTCAQAKPGRRHGSLRQRTHATEDGWCHRGALRRSSRAVARGSVDWPHASALSTQAHIRDGSGTAPFSGQSSRRNPATSP
jgi:hypothetical protein